MGLVWLQTSLKYEAFPFILEVRFDTAYLHFVSKDLHRHKVSLLTLLPHSFKMQFWGLCILHMNMALYYLMDKAWRISAVWHPAILPCFLPLAILGWKGEHVCLWSREQPVFAFSRAGWSLSWPLSSKVYQSFCNSWPLLWEKFFFSSSCSTHTNTQSSSTLCQSDVVVLDFILYLIISSQVFFPLCCSCHVSAGHLSLCQHTHAMYTEQAVRDNRSTRRERCHLWWQHLQLSMSTSMCNSIWILASNSQC